jgi:MOSC domain-containing protein YiiM
VEIAMYIENQFLPSAKKNIAPGKLEWIGLRTERHGPVVLVDSVMALAELGLEGDHRCQKIPGSARQVTLISRDYLEQVAQALLIPSIDPFLLRRNLVISGMDMDLLRFQRIQIGDAVFATSALCHPCSRMDAALGPGAKQAIMGRGGLCAKILKTGRIALGDKVVLLGPIE